MGAQPIAFRSRSQSERLRRIRQLLDHGARVLTPGSSRLKHLKPASPASYEFAQPGISFYGAGGVGFGAMYPTYVRGVAYLALGKATEAAAEFV